MLKDPGINGEQGVHRNGTGGPSENVTYFPLCVVRLLFIIQFLTNTFTTWSKYTLQFTIYIVSPYALSDQRQQKHGSAIRAAESLRQEVSQWSDTFCPNRLEVLANVNSMLGLSYLEMDRLVEALAAHEQAYALGEQCNLPEIVSHATDNIGRVHAKRGDYQEAIDM